ncbi:hypothetical protein YC2023_103817 [Brassica napus]|uniref:(rape) hypothetical protein n=1 Tax=Brassica napus TaxID=3708 RepID=A0A816UKQ1_BRANA|nr:unnamed protein product [Brassica napus]
MSERIRFRDGGNGKWEMGNGKGDRITDKRDASIYSTTAASLQHSFRPVQTLSFLAALPGSPRLRLTICYFRKHSKTLVFHLDPTICTSTDIMINHLTMFTTTCRLLRFLSSDLYF